MWLPRTDAKFRVKGKLASLGMQVSL